MEEWSHPGREAYFSPAFAETPGRTRPRASAAGLLRDRIPREFGGKPAAAGRLYQRPESPRQLSRMESGKISGGEISPSLALFLLFPLAKTSTRICEIREYKIGHVGWFDRSRAGTA